jgi:two-component system alkaline phosphatase synthesis response regulator PhoP
MKVLVVDDDPAVRRLVKHVLSAQCAAEVAEADDGVTALDYLLRHSVDLVVLDLMMPFIGGLETLEAIRRSSQHARLPVVLLSGHIEEAVVRRALRLGAEEIIAKPFTTTGLRERFVRLITKLQLQPALDVTPHELDLDENDLVVVVDVNEEFRTIARRELGRVCQVEEAPNEFSALARCLAGNLNALLVGKTSELSSVEVFGRKVRGLGAARDLRLIAAVATPAEETPLSGLYDFVVRRSFVPESFHRSLRSALGQETLARYLLHPTATLPRQVCENARARLGRLMGQSVEMHESPPALPGEARHVSAAVELQSGQGAWDVRLSCCIGAALQMAGLVRSAEDDEVDETKAVAAMAAALGDLVQELHALASADGLHLRRLPMRTSEPNAPLIDYQPRAVRRWFTTRGREMATLEIVRLRTKSSRTRAALTAV